MWAGRTRENRMTEFLERLQYPVPWTVPEASCLGRGAFSRHYTSVWVTVHR